MKCPACGNDELQEHHRFCSNCGCKLSSLQSARETGSQSINSSQEAQSVEASDAAGVQISGETNTVEGVRKRSSSRTLARDPEADVEPDKAAEELEKLEGALNVEVHLCERKNDFEGPEGVDNDSVHPTEGKKRVEKSKGAEDDAVHPSEDRKDFEKSRRVENNVVHSIEEREDFERDDLKENDAEQPREEDKDSEKSKGTGNDAVHHNEDEKDFEKAKVVLHPIAKEEEKDVEKSHGANNNVVHPSEETSGIITSEGAENDVILSSEGETYVEQPKGGKNDTVHSRKETKEVEKPKGAEKEAAHPSEGKIKSQNTEGANNPRERKEEIKKSNADHTSEEKKGIEKSQGTEREAIHPSEGKKEVQNSKYARKDAVRPREGEEDVKKSTSVKNDAVHRSEEKNDIEMYRGVEGDAAHPCEEKKDTEKPKDAEKESSHLSEGKTEVQDSTFVKKVSFHSREGEEDATKTTGVQNDAAHPCEEKKDAKKPDKADKEAKGKIDVQNTKSAKKCAVHPREGEKDVTMSTGMENDDIYSNEKTKHIKNPEIARNDEYMTVVFHALLTPTFNISFQQGDKVVLRGDPPFSWNPSKQVEIQGVRELHGGNFLLEGKVKLTLREASRAIPYKYVVIMSHQRRTAKDKDLWECLIGFRPVVSGKHVNRCLRIPEGSLKVNGTWHQYDDAIFSQPGLWESFRSLFPHNENDPAEGRRLAMIAMLPDWESISLKQGGMNAHDALTKINNVVHCMSRSEVENGSLFRFRVPYGFNIMEVLHEYLFPRLNRNIQILRVHTDDQESHGNRLITSAMIASLAILHQLTLHGDDELKKLLECLLINGESESSKCFEYDVLLSHFPKEQHLRTLADSLLRLCIHVIEYRRDIFHWLFAMPLLHFLSDSVRPFSFETLTLEPSSVKDTPWWGTQGLDFLRVRRQAAFSSNSSPVHLLHQLSPMFKIDPLFTRTFLLTLPIRDIAKVLQRKVFALHEVCWTLARVVEEIDHTSGLFDEEWESLEKCIQEINDGIAGFDSMEDSNSPYETMTSLAKAALHLLRHLQSFTVNESLSQKRFHVVSGIFKLLDQSLLLVKDSFLTDETSSRVQSNKEIFQEAFESLHDSLGKRFCWNLLRASDTRRDEELQTWSHLLSVNLEDLELHQLWKHGIRESLKSRVNQVDHKDLIELFCKLDLSAYHQDISECFESAAFEAIDRLLKVGIAEEPMALLSSRLELSSLPHRQASGVGRLFSLFLKSCWPEGGDGNEISEDKTLQHILSWKPMAQYFNYLGCGSQLKEKLSDDGWEILDSATSLVTYVGLCLRNGEIRMNTLRIVHENRDRFLELYSLLSKEDSAVTGEISEDKGNQQEARSLEIFLDMRIEELKAFEKEREAVSTFIATISATKIDVDFQGIKEKLEKDLASCQMQDICLQRSPSEKPIVKFFDLSTKIRRMMQLLHLIHPSRLFQTMWQQCIPKAADFCKDGPGSREALTVDKVEESWWTTAYRRWRGMWETILGGEISLQEVDKRFDRLRSDPKTLEIEIGVVVACFSDREDIDTTVRQRVAQIKQYHKLRECKGAATAILEFQKAMHLEGDFDQLRDFCSQLNDEFLRRPLGTIGDDVFEIGENLKRLPQQMIECLRTVMNCKEYIFWLRKEVKGREEVKTLVDLAMMSAGESDIETDRVSYLHTTALGFAPFIFDLAKSAGLSELIDVCESVWEEIEGNTDLPKQLRDISSHLEWLKGVKDAHAMSSLKLAQAINERGVYFVGKLDNVPSTQQYDKKSIDSVISLLLLPSKSNGEAREFSLEKLKELQSKLALISGKRSHGQDDVEKFGQLLQGIIQLGQTYVNLCEIGDVSHLDWTQEYKCKSVMGRNVIAEIESKSTEFEGCFRACKEHINSLRMKYQELNYFTIQQLLFLRKELAGLKHSATMNSLHLQVYALLEKVLPGLHRSSLQTALFGAGILTPHLHDDTNSDLAASRNVSEQVPPCIQEREDQRTVDQQVLEKYEQLLNNLETLDYSEPDRLAVAALFENLEGTDAELVVWCVQNKGNTDLIDKNYDKASDDPRFSGIVSQDAASDVESSQSSQHSDVILESLTEDSGDGTLDSSTEHIMLDETKGGTYLSLDEIGVFLCRLASNGERAVSRMFPSFLKRGKPNLILARKEYIFAAVLGLYMDEKAQGLPNSDEVLICSSDTTSEEVELFWRRALSDNGENLYCLVNADLLDYDVSQKVVDCLHTLMRDYGDNERLALVVLCSSENEERAYIVTSLEEYKVEGGIPRYPRPEELRRYLEKQFKAPHPRPGLYCEQHLTWSAAAEVGRAKNLNVHVVTSDHPGVGKSLVVQRLAEQVSNLQNNRAIADTMKNQDEEPPPLCVTIPFHDKRARVADVVGFFLPHALHSDIPLARIFHMDRPATVTPELETLLFNLLILGEITDDRGRVWRRNPYDLYVLEITDPPSKEQERKTEMCKFHELLPSIRCFLPKETLRLLQRKSAVLAQRTNSPLFDEEELQSEAVQRVWQYLQLYNSDRRLIQHFNFDAQLKRDDSPEECLETLIGNCGVVNPSWSELRYFVSFLNNQLRDCEENVFCTTTLVEDALEGFRTFVVAFMIIMSKDFSTRSLKENDSSKELAGADEERDITPFQLRRRWEGSPHPYIFFNRPNNDTMSFLGFRVDEEGNLLDPQTEEIIQERLMTRHLRTGLHVQRVDFNTDFESYSKPQKIELLCSVMGMGFGFDPDKSYELTGDNVKKILAIHMRFRCNIPVVIMGETGCGKTRLIRYLCRLQTEGLELKNMLLMKIHGGTTYKDIERNVLHAEMLALKNEQINRNVDTVLFFDEANTSEALGMIKEIMVDRRCNGRPLSDRLKFIVACNPYRRHTDEMIKKLESAGLGYHVRADETEERLGRIPLRHLVYRVHALPESMRSLVWDFGQLNPKVEELYTRQIVRRYVEGGRLPGDDRLVMAIATVLAASQQFMRKKKDECSFVSLRDVKRAMEVMVWFYENFNNFSPLLQDEDGDGDDDDKDDNNGVESNNREERKDERPSYSQERPIIEEELFSREDEPTAVQKEIPFFTDWRPASLTEERRPPKKERAFFEEEFSFKKQPAVRKEPLAFREGRPTLKKTPSPLKEEHPTIKERRSTLENLQSVVKERSTLKEKRPITRKARSPNEKARSTIKEMPPTFEKEGPTLVESLLPRPFPFAGRGEPIPPKEPDLPLPEELIVGAASQENLSDNIDRITWSLILALGVCYRARLTDRDEYREIVAKSFHSPCRLPGGAERIEKEISRCQEALMAQLELGPNIARNAALTENVFMMMVCIELRIPLFVVGKPGSSKSLAKTVVADNMQGENSKPELFKKFKQIQLVSYQCSPQSTPEGILATFKQCSELQESKKSDRFASVVVLDEVGLAEDSPKMPLKTLHPLLEDGNQNEEDVIQTEERFTRVAFIGLSNWALDPAKMNRGIMLCRNEPDGAELEATARGICGGNEDIMTLIEPLISPIVVGYTELYNKQKSLQKLKDGRKDEFFGLRDFYSLLKMIVHIAREEYRRPNREELEHVIKRNFSGLLEGDFDPVRIIMGHVMPDVEKEERRGLDSVDLIRASLDRKSAMGEGRYLLIMTENFAALPRVKQILLEEDPEEPYVIFGSGFPKDQLFTQVCRNINRVKICMETGRTVILLNLENLYESLYDALNQYYVTFGGENYVDLGLGNHRVKCRVHKDFRLIVIADKDVVYSKFPIPLINRLEKHFLVMSSGLTDAQEQVSRELNAWVEDFAHIFQPAHETKKRTFKKGDAFIGYHQDSVPAVVLQVCAELHDNGLSLSDEDRESWKENVLKHCQERLLQCATPDSVTRLRSSRLRSQASSLWTTYFREQEHSSLANFLNKALTDVKSRATSNTKIALRAQISTHSRLLSDRDIHDIAEVLDLAPSCVKCVSLQQFQTEQQFCNCIGRGFWARLGGRESLLIVQCDSSDQNLDLVACSRHLLIEECREMEKELDPDSTGHSHILMIVQLSRVAGGCSDFVGVQSEDWLSVHIDELCPPTEEVPAIEALVGRSVSGIFESALHKTEHNLSVSQILSSCVQEAASRIEDDEATLGRATKRIELLLKLLEKETGKGRFELVLAQRLHQLLEEKDQRTPNQGNDWLQTEALSRTVNETGTFKKALWRRFQSVVAPVLAEVIAYVDRDGNLELAASGDTWVFNLWLKIFEDGSLSELSFESFMSQEGDISVVRSKVPVPKSGYGLHAFQSKFPFSWLLKERIDELYREARSIAANSHENVTECLRTLLNSSGVNSVVSEAITEGGEKAVAACYLYDFTHMIYKPRSEEDVEVVQRAITAAAREIHHSARSAGENFVMDLALVHAAHSRIQRRLNCLSLLLQTTSDIAPDLLNTFSWDENEMTIDAIALQMCLERMEPGEDDVKVMSRRQAWCDSVLSVKIPVEEMISKSPTGDEARIGEKTESIITQCRCMWQRLSAVRMFIEHVYPYQEELDPQDLHNTLTLWKALGDWTNFSKIDSLIIVERFLVRCSEDSIPRSQADKSEDHEKFLQRCNSFFMEIVSVFCFGDDVRELDPDVFEMLMRFVTGSQSTCETKEFSPFPEFGMDSSPVVRSFLLQQLINSNDIRAKKHLERYLFEVQGLSSEVPHILNVCLLAVQCMENSWISSFSKNANLDLAINIGVITKLCQDALKILNKDFTRFDELQVDSLEAVAKARYILCVTAEYMYMSCVSDDEQWSKPGTRYALDLLFTNVRALCTVGHSRSPALYLLKQLVRRYGGHSIATISQNEGLSWIVPAEFQRREDEGMILDRFLVYGVLYREVRDSLARSILSGNTDEFIASLEALRELPGHAKDIVILLALYREVAVPQGMWSRNQHDNNALIIDVILKKFLSTSVRNLAKDLLKNSQGHGFPFLPFQDTDSMIESALPEILFHVHTVLQCINFDGILEPLKAIILAPNSMLNSFLPTMPEDSFGETAAAISRSEGGNWYQCPAGHRYFVGDCGKPTQTRDCPSCESRVAIGGEDHHLVKTNKLASRDDRSSTGHILGAPQRVIAERDLSPANVSLLRVILHSAMLAGACQQPEVVSQLIHPEVPAEDICRFIWEHLVNDVRNVSTSLERSEDEVLLLIHLVLSEIMSRSTLRELDYNGKWSTKEGRKEWENEFVNVFARPIYTNLEERLQNFYGLSVNDRRLGNDPLMREIYEVDMPPPARTAADIHPGHAAFWKHRTRVTVEHIIRQFQEVKSNMATCKILGKFLAEEHNLRAVRYLPDILALLRILSDRFHRRIDREKANQLKIRELLQEFSKKGQKENVTKLLRSFSAAWDQVRHHLSSQGRFAPSKEQCSQSIEMSSTASVLLPASAEAGVCCKGLLFFLVNVHNELVQTYCNAVNPNGSARTAEKIPLSEVSMSQLIAYDSEKDLMPVMLANCSYSLEVGKETQLQYNWETLEKRIIDRFIRGRSLVHFELDDFMFREDARDDFSFEQLRIKIPQEPIQGHNRNQILSELKDLKDVSDLLSMLEMAIGFLSRTGGNPEMKISYYLKTVLLLSEGKSSPKIKKVLQSSSLNNILDLWSTLAIVRADLLLKNGQDPFEKVPDIFKTEMPRKVMTHFSAELKKVDIDLFLSKVVEVISLWLPQEDEQTGDMGLGEYLDGKLQYEERIPEDVCVKHVIYAWQLALEARERDQGRRRSMMS